MIQMLLTTYRGQSVDCDVLQSLLGTIHWSLCAFYIAAVQEEFDPSSEHFFGPFEHYMGRVQEENDRDQSQSCYIGADAY